MRDLFPGYYAPKDFQELWDRATFVLDANVLLNLYRFPKPAADELLSVLDKIGDRLWVPYQAALEYQVNRLDVINEQRERFEKVRTTLDKSLNELTSAFEKLQLKKRHSSIDPDPFLAGTTNFFNEFKTKLKGLEKHQRASPIWMSCATRLTNSSRERSEHHPSLRKSWTKCTPKERNDTVSGARLVTGIQKKGAIQPRRPTTSMTYDSSANTVTLSHGSRSWIMLNSARCSI
jgi:PIN domain-containing protein